MSSLTPIKCLFNWTSANSDILAFWRHRLLINRAAKWHWSQKYLSFRKSPKLNIWVFLSGVKVGFIFLLHVQKTFNFATFASCIKLDFLRWTRDTSFTGQHQEYSRKSQRKNERGYTKNEGIHVIQLSSGKATELETSSYGWCFENHILSFSAGKSLNCQIQMTNIFHFTLRAIIDNPYKMPWIHYLCVISKYVVRVIYL